MLSSYILVFIFAAPSHDCGNPISTLNQESDSEKIISDKLIYKFNYDSLFPTITSEVSFYLTT